MKKLLLIFLLLNSILSYSQEGAFLEPSIGLGITSKKDDYPHEDNQNITSYNTQLLLGRRKNNWIFNIGLSFFRTGYSTYSPRLIDPLFVNLPYVVVISNVAIPVKLGYELHISKKFSVVPSLGSGFTITTKMVSTNEEIPGGGTALSAHINTSGLFFNAQTYVRYQLNSRFAFIAGPAFQYIPTRLNVDNFSQDYYTLTFNAGLQYHYIIKHAMQKPKK